MGRYHGPPRRRVDGRRNIDLMRPFPSPIACRWAALLLVLGVAAVASAEDVFAAPSRVVAVGDVHGDYEQLVRVLRSAGIVDEKLEWAGGRAHLVQTGDRLDRGPESRKVMDMLGDLRYVSPQEFAAFETPDSMLRREDLWKKWRREREHLGLTVGEEDRHTFDKEHPLGFVEHHEAFKPGGPYGGWIARQNAIVRIGDPEDEANEIQLSGDLVEGVATADEEVISLSGDVEPMVPEA